MSHGPYTACEAFVRPTTVKQEAEPLAACRRMKPPLGGTGGTGEGEGEGEGGGTYGPASQGPLWQKGGSEGQLSCRGGTVRSAFSSLCCTVQ